MLLRRNSPRRGKIGRKIRGNFQMQSKRFVDKFNLSKFIGLFFGWDIKGFGTFLDQLSLLTVNKDMFNITFF